MAQRQWLARERQPEYRGINARRQLKAIVKPRGDAIDRKIALNAVGSAANALANAISYCIMRANR